MSNENVQADTAPPAPANVLVIFGAGGDLTKRKLIPALFHLSAANMLPSNFAMVGIDRLELDSEAYRERINDEIEGFVGETFSKELWDNLLKRIYYVQGDFKNPESYSALKDMLQKVDSEQQTPGSYLFYLSTPPSFFGEISRQLADAGLTVETGDQWRRIIIEKPFGHDLASAQLLNEQLHQAVNEHQIYRIDHYLGKETVQNIMAFRFANGIIEPTWNSRYVDHVQITVAESLGVENRASYYEEAGALRDMISNHLLAVLSVVAMEPPNSFDADLIRDEQSKVLRAVQPIDPDAVAANTVRGQYGAGTLSDGSSAPAYRDEPGVAPDSNIDTFSALKLQIDSWRWAGVPFYMRTGKRMSNRYTEVVIEFKHAPTVMFRDSLLKQSNVPPCRLVLRIQPDEGIGLSLNAKIPVASPRLGTVDMNFNYADYFNSMPSTGYETLIYDCMIGDATLFKRADNIELGWAILQPVIEAWSAKPAGEFPNYPAGTWGPREADELLERDGRAWHAYGTS
jgi:glucose-6-phosphate 1-dehydrogenase